MKLTDYGTQEFKRIGMIRDDENTDKMIKLLVKDVLELLETLDAQNQSGSSVKNVLDLFNRLARFKPLSLLTGEDDEWQSCSDETLQQNKRCFSVFRHKDTGVAFDVNATSPQKEQDNTITFPYYVNDRHPFIPKDDLFDEAKGDTP